MGRVSAMQRGENVIRSAPQLALPISTTSHGHLVTYRMVLPFLPPSKNVYADWPAMWKSSAKAKWRRRIQEEVDAQMIPRAAKIGLAAILVFPTQARRDPQNYAEALWHWVPDALVKAGVIDDDREGFIDFGPNLGVKMMVDDRPGRSKEARSKTVLSITMEDHR